MFSLLQVSNSLLVVAQASAGDNKSVVGWVIVLILAAIFAAFVISILRTKPIDAVALASDGNGESSQDVVTESKVEVERVTASVETVGTTSSATKENRVSTPEPAAPKVKGLKGKKKQQKKKINAQRGVSPLANTTNSVSAKKDNDTAHQPRIAEYTPPLSAASSQGDGAMIAAPVNSTQSSESATDDVPAVEPVRLASTYAINAMANKPRIAAKKESNEKKAQNKGVVQGFHKMDKYREPIRTVDAQISTPTATRSELSSASVGGEAEPVRKEERRERRPRREPVKQVETDADGPRTLKDFLAKKPGEE
jgi:hypothetical protein